MTIYLLFLLVMLPTVTAPPHAIRRPDYARDTGLPDSILTKYEKAGWLYRLLMKKDPYAEVPPKFLSKAKDLDEAFGKKSGWIKPSVKKEKLDRHALPHQTRIRLTQPQQAQWAAYRNPGLIPDKQLTRDDYAKKIFAANPYMQYITGGNPMDPYAAAKSAEGGMRVGPTGEELKGRLPDTDTRVVKPLGRQLQPPKPWETSDGLFGKKKEIPKRLAPIPSLEKANERREAANKYFGQKNPPGFVHWPQAAPSNLRQAEQYALAHSNSLKILENGGVRAAINSDNMALADATFKHYHALEQMSPRRTEWEKNEMMKNSQRIAEAFKWERIKDKLKDTNNHIVSQMKAAVNNLPKEMKIQTKYGLEELKRMHKSYPRYGQNEMHAERNKLFRREKVSTHPINAAFFAGMLLQDGMAGHWPHIDDKDNRHFGVASPYAGGPYNPIQSTFNSHGPFRSWHPDPLSYKCIGAPYGLENSKDCFTNGQSGAGWGMGPAQHSLSHPAEYQILHGMQFSQEERDNLRRKWIKAGTAQHQIEQKSMIDRQNEEEFQYPHRYSAYRRDDTQPLDKSDAQRKIEQSYSKEDRPDARVKPSSTFAKLSQATAPRWLNWNLQYVQDHNFNAPKTLGLFIPFAKQNRRTMAQFDLPIPNVQKSPDEPKLVDDLRHPDPNGGGALDNPMAGLFYEVENGLRNPRATYEKTFGSNPQGLHQTDPGIPDIIMEGRLICFGDVGAFDAQISLYSDDDHISSAFTDKEGRFKLETTMDYAPHSLKVKMFHQCKESRSERLAGKGEEGTVKLPLKYGDRRVYDLRTVDSSDPVYEWERVQKQIPGVDYQGDGIVPEFARMRPCSFGSDSVACDEDIFRRREDYEDDYGHSGAMEDNSSAGDSDLTDEAEADPGHNQLGLNRDQPQPVPMMVRH